MAEKIIHDADLGRIEKNLSVIHSNIDAMNSNISEIDGKVAAIYDDIADLADKFDQYVQISNMQHEQSVAETRLVQIRQELADRFGQYKIVRNTTTGILQAADLTIVRKQTISCATEELMIATPRYWLTPCLIALAAWINDDRTLSEKALREGIRRNDEKTSLLFTLVCRRANRQDASLKWTDRYFGMQDPENLDRNCMVMLDAFASGILANDSEGLVSKRINKWLEELSQKPGFVELQAKQWKDALFIKRGPVDLDFTYLPKYSPTWPVLSHIMEGAFLHGKIYGYFKNIFDKQNVITSVEEQIDNILMSLVTNYDDEELPLREEEELNALIVQFKGDTDRAQAHMDMEHTAFMDHKSLTQLLTDAAMKPAQSHASVNTQQFAVALSRDWILESYGDIVAENRAKVPVEIEITVENFTGTTTDGSNEQELADNMNELLDSEKANLMEQIKMNMMQRYGMFAGIGLCAFAIFMPWVAILGVGAIIYHLMAKKDVTKRREALEVQFEEHRKSCCEILRATLAEVVDFRIEFTRNDSESSTVTDFLTQLSPDQYVRNISGGTRKIRT